MARGVRGGGNIQQSEGEAIRLNSIGDLTYMHEDRVTEARKTWFNNSAFVNYLCEMDTNKSNLEINLNYQLKIIEEIENYNGIYNDLQNNLYSEFGLNNDSRSHPNIVELRAAYEHRFNDSKWKLNFGGSYSVLFNKMKLETRNTIVDNLGGEPFYANSYDYTEQIGSVFTEVSKSWEKLSVRVGLRSEYTYLNGYSNSLLTQFIDSVYFLPFPTASILYEPTDKIAMSLRYSSGINRPQFSNYDPFVKVLDSLSIQYGNPNLRPSTLQNFGFDIDLFFAYSLSVDYTFANDVHSNLNFIEDSTFLLNSTPWNADRSHKLSFSLNLPIKTKWVDGWNSFSLVYNKYEFSSIFNRSNFDNVNFSFWSTLNFHLRRKFTISNRIYIVRWGDDSSVAQTMTNWGVRLTKKMMKNRLKIFFDISDILSPQYVGTIIGNNFKSESLMQYQFTSFKIGCHYKFGRLKKSIKIKGSSSEQSGRI